MEAVIDREPGASLAIRAATGDELAFARLVDAHHDDMARVAYVICGDADLAQEAAQAAWPLAWRKVGSVRDPSKIRAWLVSIAANEARQLVRRRSRRAVREVAVDSEPAQTAATRGGDPGMRAAEMDLANAMARLGDTDRAIVALRYVAGLTSEEIGGAIGMTSGGVRARTARVLDRLRRDLEG
ncbi:MAG TPA: RNA polymerase sigma factor [Candidatus Binatus sp.]|nr:RNA polymerase sigma factor [Candidatus Binatus sp.]